MSGIYSGVQRQISDMEPNIVYIHYAAYNLNLHQKVGNVGKSAFKANTLSHAMGVKAQCSPRTMVSLFLTS